MVHRPADDRLPVLVGCGDVTDATTPIEVGRSPFDLIAQAARLALEDAGASGLAGAIDTVAMLRLFSDTSPRFRTKLGASITGVFTRSSSARRWPRV